MKTKILADFQICIKVPLNTELLGVHGCKFILHKFSSSSYFDIDINVIACHSFFNNDLKLYQFYLKTQFHFSLGAFESLI